MSAIQLSRAGSPNGGGGTWVNPVGDESQLPNVASDGSIGLVENQDVLYRYYAQSGVWKELPIYFLFDKMQAKTDFLMDSLNNSMSSVNFDDLTTLNYVQPLSSGLSWDGYFITGSGLVYTDYVSLPYDPTGLLVDISTGSGTGNIAAAFTLDSGNTWNNLPYSGSLPSGNVLGIQFSISGTLGLSSYGYAYR